MRCFLDSKSKIQKLLDVADIQINGSRPWDVQVANDHLYNRVLSGGSLALGEAYVEGWWDADDLSEFFTKLHRANLRRHVTDMSLFSLKLRALLLNPQNKRRSAKVVDEHYELGNDLYRAMLGKTVAYSCAYWRNLNNLDDAQEAKFDLICRKLRLKEGQRLLEIGCGWGGFSRYASENYGAKVTAITISKKQVKLAQQETQGLPVEVRFQDYRDVADGPFDHIVSIGMFEHVGPSNYNVFFRKVNELLSDNGLLLLHTIGSKYVRRTTDPWINKYIFPNGVMPTIGGIGNAINSNHMVMEDWHNFGMDYDRTLMCWYKNFTSAWPDFQSQYGDLFYRKWVYYLLSSAATFRARLNDLWQITVSKDGLMGGYEPVR